MILVTITVLPTCPVLDTVPSARYQKYTSTDYGVFSFQIRVLRAEMDIKISVLVRTRARACLCVCERERERLIQSLLFLNRPGM